MPIYEYHCHDCGAVNVCGAPFRRRNGTARCPRCGGERLTRLISKVRVVRSEESRMETCDPSSLGYLDENDPAHRPLDAQNGPGDRRKLGPSSTRLETAWRPANPGRGRKALLDRVPTRRRYARMNLTPSPLPRREGRVGS